MTLSRRRVLALTGACLAAPVVGHAAGRLHEVAMRRLAFEPEQLDVAIGDSIRFTNHDLAPHTATAEDGSWDSGTLAKGDSATLEVTADWGTDYFCAFHPHMTARLVISGG